MNKVVKYFFLVIFAMGMLASCTPQKKITYFQPTSDSTDSEVASIVNPYKEVVQKGDILSIKINSLSPEASQFFNPYDPQRTTTEITTEGYQVDNDGNIELPLVGTISVEGMSFQEIKKKLKTELEKYLQNPTVSIRFLNFRVTVLGEVNKPGVIPITTGRVSLPEALALAGDLTIFGKRDNIMLIRETGDKREFVRIDINNRKFFATNYYYLQNNDVIYVEPGKNKKINADTFFKIAPWIVSIAIYTFLIIRTVN